MSGLTFVSTTSTPEQMREDLGPTEPVASRDAPAGAAVVTSMPEPEGTETPVPAAEPPAETPAASAAPSPRETPGADDKTSGEEYPELGGMTSTEFASLPEKTQRRIAKLTRKLRETETRVSALAPPAGASAPPTTPGQATAASPTPETPAGAPATAPDIPPDFRAKPESDAFETWAEYEEALVDWKLDLREAKRAHAEKQTAETRQQQAEQEAAKVTLDAFQARREQAKADYPDFDEIVTTDPIQVDDPRKLRDLERLVVEATSDDGTPIGPDILYHLGKHKPDLDRILAAKTPVQLAMILGAIQRDVELGRTSQATIAEPPRPQPRITNAPAPIRSVAGASSVASSDLDDNLPQAEWERKREAQLRARASSGRR